MTNHERTRPVATSGLRQAGYAAILTALAFSQSAGQMVADTKFDLVTGPRRFLTASLHLWDPSAAFGQLQNQAYGYAWPMGPFFVLGELVRLPPWVVQRLWWALLLCLAFFGVLRLARRLDLGSPASQVLAAFAYVLTPRITTLLGGTSVEVWPMAIAPWVLLPLVRGSQDGNLRRCAALSALAVATAGGVNAVAVAAVLPLGVVWLLTSAPRPRRWRLLGWWTLFTALATAWWWVPLLLLGRYSVPFLDYIENATITTLPTDLARTLMGESDWVAYFAGIDYQAGQQLVTTEFLMLDAAAVAALGLVGIALRDNRHQRFLTWAVLVGVALVGFGYAGDLSGFFAEDRAAALDGALAPLRNLHKFDVVLRIPLVLGLAHVVSRLPQLFHDPASPRASRAAVTAVRAMAVLAVASLALPWAQDRIAPRQGVDEVPSYWPAVARYLEAGDDGTVALELPASAFGVYDWGNTHDDVLQGLAGSAWALRNVIPLAQPGNVVALDAVTRTVESGRPSRSLARFLAANGVGRIVVRNDLDRFQTAAPDPAYVRAVLSASPGITLERSFGPVVGSPPVTVTEEGSVRVTQGNGLSAETGSVDVYRVDDASSAELSSGTKLVVGDPSAGLRSDVAGLGAGDSVLAEDATGAEDGQVLTDGTRRRETNFAAVRWNESATLGADEDFRLPGPENTHRFLDHQERWQTTELWTGQVSDVRASSSQAYADALPPLQIGSHPGAALDHDPSTAWRSSAQLDATGQFWQADFTQALPLASISVRLAPDSAAVESLELSTNIDTEVVPAPAPGESRRYQVDFESAAFLRVTAAGRDLVLPGSLGISEVGMPVRAQRFLQLPEPHAGLPVDRVSLQRDTDRAACVPLGRALACADALDAPGEDGDVLARRFSLPAPGSYRISGTVSLRRHVAGRALVPGGPVARSDDPDRDRGLDVGRGPLAAVDGSLSTTWVASTDDDVLDVTLPAFERVQRIRLRVNDDAPVSRPTVISVRSGDRETEVELDELGRAELPGWKASNLQIGIVETEQSFGIQGPQFVPNPPGISELTVNGSRIVRDHAAARAYPCGSGPEIRVGSTLIETAVRAPLVDLVRGSSVVLEPCSRADLDLPAGLTDVQVTPSPLFRADTVTLTRVGASTAVAAQPVDVRRDSRGQPVSAELPDRTGSSLLTLDQNVNSGWTATLAGRPLVASRTDGWKQAWVVPAGAAGRVTFDYEPETSFRVALVVGVVALLLCLGAALWPGRRREGRLSPARSPAPRVGIVDLVLAVAVGGLVAGWWGLAGFGAAALIGGLLRRFPGWALLSGLAMVAVGVGVSWERITLSSYAGEWRQGWSVVALALCVAALAARRGSDDPDRDDAEMAQADRAGA